MKLFFILITSLGFCYNALGQGCSNAGFCTAGGIKPSVNNDSIENSVGFSIGYAIGEQGTLIVTPQFEPQVKVSDKSMVQIKIPFVYIKGNAGNNTGLGNVVMTYNYNLGGGEVSKQPVTLTIGTRIATGTASLKGDNIPLPMPYQVSLGTTDLILGARIQLKKGFSVSVGYQQPVFNRNQNGFDSLAFKDLAKAKQLQEKDNYFISSYLERKGDILLRLDKTFRFKNTMISTGLLPIYHLGKDKARINKGTTVEIDNSQGLTLNLNAGIYHRLNSKLELSAVAATPLLVRESRPDGLTRALVFVSGIRYYF